MVYLNVARHDGLYTVRVGVKLNKDRVSEGHAAFTTLDNVALAHAPAMMDAACIQSPIAEVHYFTFPLPLLLRWFGAPT